MIPTAADIDSSSSSSSSTPTHSPAGSAPIKKSKLPFLTQESQLISPSPPAAPLDPDAVDQSPMEGLVTTTTSPSAPESKNEIRVQDRPGTHSTTTPLIDHVAALTNRELHEPDHTNVGVLTNDSGEHPQRNTRTSLTNLPARASSSSPAKVNGRNGYARDHLHPDLHPDHPPLPQVDDQDDVDMEVDHDIAHHPSDDKYKRLKRKLKQVLEENERMSRELDKSHRRVRNLRREKTLLLNRLCTLEQQDQDSSSDSLSSLSSDSDTSDSSLSDDIRPRNPFSTLPSGKANNIKTGGARRAPSAGATTATAQPSKQGEANKGAQRQTSGTSGGGGAASGAARTTKEGKPPTTTSTPSTITNVGSATQKPKRIHQTNKQRPGLAKARKVQALEKDEAGNIKFPVTVGIITIWSIGHVVYDREAFHNDRYIWPVGYKMSRLYNSMIDPLTLTTYTCSVIDDGEAPKFQIDAEDQPGKPIIAGTATGAWTHIVKAANAIRKREHSNSASGPDYFGFSNATIAKMIQDLPNADKCSSYIMQRFEEPSPSSKGGEKRKASALGSATKSGENDNEAGDQSAAEEDDGEDADGDEEVDEESYTTLGTPGKKKARLSSPAIRQAGLGASATGGSEVLEPVDTSMEGDETHSEDDQEDWEAKQRSKSGSAPAATAPGSSKPANDSGLDTAMDGDATATTTQNPPLSSAAQDAPTEHEGVAPKEDSSQP